MKLTKKLLALVLASAMIFSLCSFASSSDEITPFKIGISRLEMRDSTFLNGFGTYLMYDGQESNLEKILYDFAILVDWSAEQGCYVVESSRGKYVSKTDWDIPDTGFVVAISYQEMLAFDAANLATIGYNDGGTAEDTSDDTTTCGGFQTNNDLAGQPVYFYGIDPVLGTIDATGFEYDWTRYVNDPTRPTEPEISVKAYEGSNPLVSNAYMMIGGEDENATTRPFVSHNARITKLPVIGSTSYYDIPPAYGVYMSHYYPVFGLYKEALGTEDTDDMYDECFFVDPSDYANADELYEALKPMTFVYGTILERDDNGNYKVIHSEKWGGTKSEWAYTYFSEDPDALDSPIRKDRILLCTMVQTNAKENGYGFLTYEFGYFNKRTAYYAMNQEESGRSDNEGLITGMYANFQNVDFVNKTVKTYGEWGKSTFASDSYVYFSEEPIATKAVDERSTNVYRTLEAPKMDGVIGENEYTLVSNDFSWKCSDDKYGTAAAAEKNMYATYDDENLYLAASITCGGHINAFNTEEVIDWLEKGESKTGLDYGHSATFAVTSADPLSDEISDIVNQDSYNFEKAFASAASRRVTIALTDNYYNLMYSAFPEDMSSEEGGAEAALNSNYQMSAVAMTRVAAEEDSFTVGDYTIKLGVPHTDLETKTVSNPYPEAYFCVSHNGNTGALKDEDGNAVKTDDEFVYQLDETDDESGLDVYEITLPWSWIDYRTDIEGNGGSYETNGVLNVRQQQLQLGTKTIDDSVWYLDSENNANSQTVDTRKTADGTYFGLAAVITTGSALDDEGEPVDMTDLDALSMFDMEKYYAEGVSGYKADACYGTNDLDDFTSYRTMYLAGYKPVEQTLTDADTGITVEGLIPEGAQLVVTPLTEEHVSYAAFQAIVGQDGTLAHHCDIQLVINGEPVELTGSITITFPVNEEDGTELVIGHFTDDGVEQIKATVADSKVSATVSSLSPFAVMKLAETDSTTGSSSGSTSSSGTRTSDAKGSGTTSSSSSDKAPTTGDDLTNVILLGLISLAGIATLEVKKRKTNRI